MLARRLGLRWRASPPAEAADSRRRSPRSVLLAFRWLCKNPEDLELVAADLHREARDMLREGRSRRFVQAILAWRYACEIAYVLWVAAVRVGKRVVPLGAAWRFLGPG